MMFDDSSADLSVNDWIAVFERIVVFAVTLQDAVMPPDHLREPERNRAGDFYLHDRIPVRQQETIEFPVVCNHALWDAVNVAQVHRAGMKCLSYTVNDEWAAQRLLTLGTDGIITDRVDLFAPK